MKITKEMKDIISRKIDRQREEERKKYTDELMIKQQALNKEFMGLPEFQTLLTAYKNLDSKIIELNKATPNGLELDSRGLGHKLSELACGYDVGFYWMNCESLEICKKYDDLKDSIVIRLSYGENFDDVKKILEEYDIEI